MSRRELAERLAALYDRKLLREYVRWKVKTDPAYAAVLEALRESDRPVVDLGCGVGLLPFFLREQGYTPPILGIDFDERKIGIAHGLAARYADVRFRVGDARDPLPAGHNVVILDILQYFSPPEQQEVLANAARSVAPGGMVVIRQGIRDGSWRHRLTQIVDAFGRASRWMKAEHTSISFPSTEEISRPFGGFTREVRPLWGRMPYNNYFFVFRPPSTDHQQER